MVWNGDIATIYKTILHRINVLLFGGDFSFKVSGESNKFHDFTVVLVEARSAYPWLTIAQVCVLCWCGLLGGWYWHGSSRKSLRTGAHLKRPSVMHEPLLQLWSTGPPTSQSHDLGCSPSNSNYMDQEYGFSNGYLKVFHRSPSHYILANIPPQ